MDSAFNWLRTFETAGFIPEAIFGTLLGIVLPLAFILARRAYRQRYFRRRDARTLHIRSHWNDIVSGRMSPEAWRLQPLDRDIVESILLDQLDVAEPEEAERLRRCLRVSGLLDMRIWEARRQPGWRQRRALVSLGRMRAPEAVPALAEALDHPSAETRIAALRGLGRTAMPAAAEEILRRVTRGPLRFPASPLQNALLHCCQSRPGVLVPYLRRAEDSVRPLLARVLGELATPDLEEDLIALASDPLAEVRASAARGLGEAKPRLALTALSSLAADQEWFVRLRAVVALGQLRDLRTVPVLIGTLCDANRYVRVRSAAALARLGVDLERLLQQVIHTRDRYALQALVSELERSGRLLELVNDLRVPERRQAAVAALLGAIGAGAHRMLLDSLMHHPDWRTRCALARVLAQSGRAELLPPLERLEAGVQSRRLRLILCWVMERLREQKIAPPRTDRVPA